MLSTEPPGAVTNGLASVMRVIGGDSNDREDPQKRSVGGDRIQVLKDSPQPHSETTFGFSTWNPAAWSPDSKSSVLPSM